jgi:hypothetical protein
MKSINNNSSNAYNFDSYINRTVISRRRPELKVIETEQKKIASDKDMTLTEKIIMNVVVWGGFTTVAWLFATGDWWQ